MVKSSDHNRVAGVISKVKNFTSVLNSKEIIINKKKRETNEQTLYDGNDDDERIHWQMETFA